MNVVKVLYVALVTVRLVHGLSGDDMAPVRRLYKQVQQVYEEWEVLEVIYMSLPLVHQLFTLCVREKRKNSSPALLYQPVIFRGLNYDNK